MGQTVAAGEKLFNNGQYKEAREVYSKLLSKRSPDPLNNYRYARCCYELNLKEEAIVYFEKSKSISPAAHYYLGNLYFDAYQFDAAVDAYKSFLKVPANVEKQKIAEVNTMLKRAQIAAELIKEVEDIDIIDSIVVNKNNFLRHYNTPPALGTFKQEFLVNNGKRIDKITHENQQKNKRHSSNENNGQMDIYSSYKLSNTWLDPILKSKEINTPANENYPFVMSDDITILYASDGDKSIGGYDIFITRYDTSKNGYSAPENIGMPFNSPYNDYMMVIDEQNKVGWFASDRYQPEGKVMIYKFKLNDRKKIVRRGDDDYIRAAAQLKPYKQLPEAAIPPQQITEKENIIPEVIPEEETIIIIEVPEIIGEGIIQQTPITEVPEDETIIIIEIPEIVGEETIQQAPITKVPEDEAIIIIETPEVIEEEIILQIPTIETVEEDINIQTETPEVVEEEIILQIPTIETVEEGTNVLVETPEVIEKEVILQLPTQPISTIENKSYKNQIEVYIIDTIVYDSASQFKSPKALQLYLELCFLTRDNDAMRGELSSLKSQYIETNNDEERNKLTSEIASLERYVRGQAQHIHEKTIELRYEEIKYIRTTKPKEEFIFDDEDE